jgi:hypothetical protein
MTREELEELAEQDLDTKQAMIMARLLALPLEAQEAVCKMMLAAMALGGQAGGQPGQGEKPARPLN